MLETKTNMLTPEQFNQTDKKLTNCLGFAIGAVGECPTLDAFDGRKIEDAFISKLRKYGLIVKKVTSLVEIDGKTGFLLYGFYPTRTLFGIQNIDFHVVRVNPDGSLVHKPDRESKAMHTELLTSSGGIVGYNRPNEPIQVFLLEKELNPNIENIKKRISIVLTQIIELLDSPNINSNVKEKLKERSNWARAFIGGLNNDIVLNSNDVNIIFQELTTLISDINYKSNLESGIEPENWLYIY